ncbi:MAG: acyl-CoA dehydrogenase family protein [Acidimicrobiales bacterium]
MDFALTDEQQTVVDLAEQILSGQLTPERFKEVEASEDRFDRRLWTELAKAGLLGVSLPSGYGGADLDFMATALLGEQIGRAAAPVPFLPTVALGALPIAQFGSDELKAATLPAVASGELVLTAALVEPGTDPRAPSTSARPDGSAWRLDGAKTCVPAGWIAGRILVPARTGEGTVGVFVVDPAAPGVTLTRLRTTTGNAEAMVDLAGVAVGAPDVLGSGSDGAEIVDWMVAHNTSAMCSVMAGAAKQVVALTASYTKTREQFDRQIATFQAVAQRAADAYVDAEAIHLTARQAAWRLSQHLPAVEEVAIAKFWAAEGGQRVVHAAQHLHGGMGVDRDYPLHRYFLLAKELELSLGGTTAQLLKLGNVLATQPV